MLPSHSMRSHIALFIAILVSLLCALLGSLISQQIRHTPRARHVAWRPADFS